MPARAVFLPAFWVALALEGAKYVNLLIWPLLRKSLPSMGRSSFAAIILWSFLASMIVLACGVEQPAIGEKRLASWFRAKWRESKE